MTFLPDDVLIHIFSSLPPRDLMLAVRGVCTQWRRLSLHKEVWRDQELVVSAEHAHVAFLTLRLAPRLRGLRVEVDDTPPFLMDLARSTRCRVDELDLRAWTSDCAKEGLLVLQNQERSLRQLTLGFSRRVRLSWVQLQYLAALQLDALVVAKNSCFTLENMTLVTRDDILPALYLGCSRPPRTQRLHLDGIMAPVLKDALVRSLAGCLTSVHLGGRTSRAAVASLAACEQLREAVVPAVSEVALLTGCAQLSSIGLWMDSDCTLHADGLHSYLVQGATWLRKLRFIFSRNTFQVNQPTVVLLLTALAATRCSALEELQFDVTNGVLRADAFLTEAVLKGLPRLRVLRLMSRMPERKVLESLTPWVVPKLELLDVGSERSRLHVQEWSCPAPNLAVLLRVNPRLHVIGTDLRYCELGSRCGAGVCCHEHRAAADRRWSAGVFAHRRTSLCALCRELEERVLWRFMRLPAIEEDKQCCRCLCRKNLRRLKLTCQRNVMP